MAAILARLRADPRHRMPKPLTPGSVPSSSASALLGLASITRHVVVSTQQEHVIGQRQRAGLNPDTPCNGL